MLSLLGAGPLGAVFRLRVLFKFATLGHNEERSRVHEHSPFLTVECLTHTKFGHSRRGCGRLAQLPHKFRPNAILAIIHATIARGTLSR